jgi:L-serine deaminase
MPLRYACEVAGHHAVCMSADIFGLSHTGEIGLTCDPVGGLVQILHRADRDRLRQGDQTRPG